MALRDYRAPSGGVVLATRLMYARLLDEFQINNLDNLGGLKCSDIQEK